MFVNVILSGGVGSRLWPLSRKSRPKQYIPMFGGKSLFQLCAMRNRNIFDLQLIVGNVDNHKLSNRDMEALGYGNFISIIEAEPRNTAAAIAFAAFSMKPDDVMMVTPSDHAIGNERAYQIAIDRACMLAKEDNLVTFGVKATRPDTGFGYIEYNGEDVVSFREKPDTQTAESFLQTGRFLWNSGMFCFKAGVFLSELEQHQPEVYRTAARAWKNKDYQFLPAKESRLIPSVSVDVAVMERSEKIKVVPASFDWTDLGSFAAIWDYGQLRGDEEEKFSGLNLALGTRKHVEFIGMENTILVETEDAILVMPRNKSQEVKNVYERLEKERPELLR